MGRYLKVSEAAVLLGLQQKAILKRVARGELPYRRWGRRILIPEEELRTFLAALPGRSAEEATMAMAGGCCHGK
jgi:excisionase family DNA binding protein